MNGNFYCCTVSQLLRKEYWNSPVVFNQNFLVDHKDDTMIVIFTRSQDMFQNLFEAEDGKSLRILHKSKQAVNPNYRTDGPRNTCFVFEAI